MAAQPIIKDKNIYTLIVSYLVIGGFFLLVHLFFFAPVAEGAATQNMPAQDDFTNTGGPGEPGVKLVVSNQSPGNSLIAPQSIVRIYSKTKNVRVEIAGWRHCAGNHDTNYISKTNFMVFRTNQNEIQSGFAKTPFDNGGNCGSNETRVLNVTAGQKSQLPGHRDYYVLIFRADLTGGGVNSFNLRSPGNRIGYSDTASERFALQDRTRDYNTKMNAKFEFAPPCDFTRNQTVYLRWSDDDYNASPQSPFNGQLDASLEERAPGSGWRTIIGSMKNKFRGSQSSSSQDFVAKPDHKYRWTWKNVAKSNGIQFKLPFDSFWFDTDCPPEEGWRNTVATSVNLKRVQFVRVDVPAGPDTKPTKPNQPNVPKPNANNPGSLQYTPGMDCSEFSSQTNRNRCNTWNDYHNRLDDYRDRLSKYNARQAAKQTNRDRAVNALHRIRFTHKITNRAPSAANVKHGATPANSGGCSSSTAISSYCARIQYRVFDQSNGGWSEWRWRFSDNSAVSSASESQENINNRGYSVRLDKRQTRHVYRDIWNTAQRPQGMPPASKSMDDSPRTTAVNLHHLLKAPQQGDQYCERVATRKQSFRNNERIQSAPKCVELYPHDEGEPYWNLKPMISVGGIVPQGENVTPQALVYLPVNDNGYDNDDDIEEPGKDGDGPDGEPYTSAQTVWEVSTFTMPPNFSLGDLDHGNLDTVNMNGLGGCQWIMQQAPMAQNCHPNSNAVGTWNPSHAPTGLSPNPGGTGHLPVGSQICFMTSVNHPMEGHPGDAAIRGHWRHSPAACATIVKAPKVQFLNGDVRAGRGFEGYNMEGQLDATPGVCSPAAGNKANIVTSSSAYGSWVEYGAFATGQIAGFSSAATPSSTRLTFGNNGTSGNFTFANCMPNYFGWVDDTKATNVNGQASGLNVASLNGNAQNQYMTTGQNVTINGASNIANKAILKVSGGNVTINGNLTFANGPYSSIGDLPQLIIIADGDITINENVEQIDAWLIARGKINTCGSNVTPNNFQCTRQLRINGPVAASKLNLYRTFGADMTTPDVSRPAELFTLHPVHLLKRYAPNDRNSTNPSTTILSEIELPPRY